MFLFGKKKPARAVPPETDARECETPEEEELTQKSALGDEHIDDELDSDIELDSDVDLDSDIDDIDEDTEEETSSETPTCEKEVSFRVGSVSELAEFANSRKRDGMQFMSKKTHEVFELRDSHFRLARVWGSVTAARECTPEEYARIMLAMDVIENEGDHYVLPGLTDAELDLAIIHFCEDKFSVSGKKYSKDHDRFIRFLTENDRFDDWKEYTFTQLYSKLEQFCETNGIVFDGDTESTVMSESDDDGEV